MSKNNLVIKIDQPRRDVNRNDLLITAVTGWVVSILGYMIRRDPKNDSDVQLGTMLERMGEGLTVGSTVCTLVKAAKQSEISYKGKVIY